MTAAEIFFSFLRAEIKGEPAVLPEDSAHLLPDVVALAESQDMIHLVYQAVKRSGAAPRDSEQWRRAEQGILREIYRSTGNELVLQKASQTLESAGIPFLPLKGAVVRARYPEPWMRASCDTDLLVHEGDLERALDALTAAGFETDRVRSDHDVSLYLQGAHLELHFSIREGLPAADGILDEVWAYSERKSGCRYEQTPAFLAFHLIAHAADHFRVSGCGVKPFLDLWVLRRSGSYDENDLRPLLERSGLTAFYEAMLEAISVWFEGAVPTELTERIQAYVLRGGAYGSFQNEAAGEIHKSGRFRYLMRVVFPPRRDLEKEYPELGRSPALLPICLIHRLWRKTVGRDRKKAGRKLRTILTEDPTAGQESGELLARLGLDGKEESV